MANITGVVKQFQITLNNKANVPFMGFTISNDTEHQFITTTLNDFNLSDYIRECMSTQQIVSVDYDAEYNVIDFSSANL